MTITGDAAGFFTRFPNTGISSADVNSVWLTDAKEWVSACLAEQFPVPFSSNNLTASRLAYQKAWHLIRLRTLNPDDSTEMGEALEKNIDALNGGEKGMILDDDTVLYATPQHASGSEDVWSNTMQFTPTFDEDEAARQEVDPDKITDLRRGRA